MTILVVDDNELNVYQLEVLLKAHGYQVTTAANGATALAAARQAAPDLVITDILMPVMDGFALCREWQADAGLQRIPLVFYTATYTDDRDREFALSLGAAAFLVKPEEPEVLLQTVREALRPDRCPTQPVSPAASGDPPTDDMGYLTGYNQALVRKLEAKMAQLSRANRALELDIAERRKVEAALRESEARLRLALSAARAVAWEADLRSGAVRENGPADLLFGLAAGTCHADLAAFFASVHPDDRDRLRQQVDAAAQGDGSFTAVFRVVAHDGSIRWIDSQGQVAVDGDGQPVSVQGIGRDVTEQRRLQTALAQADRLASLGLLAAGVAHEINNPLSYLLYHLEGLTAELPGLLVSGSEAADLLQRAHDALQGANRICEISRSLGAFSRVEEAAPAPVVLQTAIEHACRMARNEVKHRATLATEFDEHRPRVMATEGKLAQVFLNLLVNAAHAIEPGSGPNTITVRTWRDGERVRAQVRDTGRGIRPEHLAHVFEPFFTTKPAGVGSGLGLPICRDILSNLGGGIDVCSEPGVGTVFDLWLPLAPGEPAAPGAPAQTDATAAPARGRLLIVDDDETVRDMLCRVMQAQHEVVAACSGVEAQQRVQAGEQFDAILCDVMMPQMSGVELHRWLCDCHPQLARRVIFVTGGAFLPGAREYLDGSGNPCVAKPFQLAAVLGAVNRMVVAGRSGP